MISYDRLINESPDVDYYVTFDNNKVGVQQGTSLLIGLGIKDKNGKDTAEKGPFNIELFAGSPDDNNAEFFFNGAMSVLKPYVDSGVLKVPSKQTPFQQVAIQQWTMKRHRLGWTPFWPFYKPKVGRGAVAQRHLGPRHPECGQVEGSSTRSSPGRTRRNRRTS